MTLPRIAVLSMIAAATALLLAAPALRAAEPADAARAACTPRPASEPASQSPDALSASLDTTHPVALANWDARGWQRRRIWITLQADNRGDVATQVLPQMVIDARVDGGAAFVQLGRPIALAPHARARQRLAVYVPDDSRTLGVRTLVATPAQPVALAFAIECSTARYDVGEFAPAVGALLDEAVKTWFNGFVDPLSDPHAVFEAVRRLSSGAQDAEDVAWTLRGLMQSANDDHGFVVLPGEAVPEAPVPASRPAEFEWRDDGVAVVRLHPVPGAPAAATEAWASALHEGVAGLRRRRPIGWILDLRDMAGESPWAPLAGLSTLLQGPLVGAFVTRQGREDWIVGRGAAGLAGAPPRLDLQAPPAPDDPRPVAVLIGPGTRDAGEDVAVALLGRPRARLFGAPTAGFPAAGVRMHRLGDGSLLGVLERRDVDRQGRVQRLAVEPDTRLSGAKLAEAVPPEAVGWLLDEPAGGADRR